MSTSPEDMKESLIDSPKSSKRKMGPYLMGVRLDRGLVNTTIRFAVPSS